MKKLLIFLLLLPGLFSACGESGEIPPETEIAAETEALTEPEVSAAEPIRYVSLGDSIARGYGLSDVRGEVYSAVLTDTIREAGGAMEADNFGVDGQDSTELAAYILNNSAIPEAVAEADYVSVSIGANNFLGDAFTFFDIYNDFKTNPSAGLTSEDISEAFRQFNANVTEGVARLREDIPEILENLRASNEDCEILFLTCYNPYGAVNVTLDWGGVMPVSFAALADASVTQMNEVIRDLADDCGYSVAEVYAAFDGKADRLVNPTPVDSGDTFDMNALDPHPNKNGHAVIADVLAGMIE